MIPYSHTGDWERKVEGVVQTVRKVAEILDLFSAEKPERGVSEVARELSIPKSTAHALMGSLADQRLLQRTDKGRYQLGWKLFEFGQTLLDATQIRTAARAVMQDLVQRLGETVHLATLDGTQAVYIERLPRVYENRCPVARKGDRRPAHRSAVGKVLLAHREWEDIEPLLRHQGLYAATDNTITSPQRLKKELLEVRERRCGYDIEETALGLCCVAAPVFNDRNKVIAAISLSASKTRFEARTSQYHGAVMSAAGQISRSATRGLATYSEGVET